jgi:hypothetical protein
MLVEIWEVVRPFLPFPSNEDWRAIRRLSRKNWGLFALFAVFWFAIGVAWANRANGDTPWWRYSNYRLREQVLTSAIIGELTVPAGKEP